MTIRTFFEGLGITTDTAHQPRKRQTPLPPTVPACISRCGGAGIEEGRTASDLRAAEATRLLAEEVHRNGSDTPAQYDNPPPKPGAGPHTPLDLSQVATSPLTLNLPAEFKAVAADGTLLDAFL